MNRKTAIKNSKCKELLVNKCAIIDGASFDELIGCTREIRCITDETNRRINLHFQMKIRGNRYLPRSFFESAMRGSNSPYYKTISLIFEGYAWDRETLKEIVGRILETNNLKIELHTEDQISLTGSEPLNKADYLLINFALSFLFSRPIKVFNDLEKKETEKANKSYRTNAREGVYCCFKLEKRVDHSGKAKYRAGFTDLKDYYWFSISNLSEPEEAEKLFNSLRIDQWYRCTFNVSNNIKFADVFDAFLSAAEPVERESGLGNKTRKDQSEFGQLFPICSHSKNSVLDGLYTAEELVKEAVQRDHKAIGLTDLGSVQSFPSFHAAATREGIKALYGVELEIVTPKTPILMGGYSDNWLDPATRIGDPIGKGWDGRHFCILDIETTGLYPNTDEIIQINARKFEVLDEDFSKINEVSEFNQYIRIGQKLQQITISLTNITDEKLESQGIPLVEALEGLKKFVKGSMLVAHNGLDFDIPFINAHLRKNKMEELKETVLDTLKFSHYLFDAKKFKSHSLAALSKKTNFINYDETQAHDAKYDTDILAKLFFKYLLPELKFQGSLKLSALKELNEQYWRDLEFNRFAWGERALIYARNQKGIELLYRLVSICHIENYCDGIRLLRSHIVERENLLIVSDPINGELMRAVLKDDFQLFKSLSSWYDYAAVPPPSHFVHEVERGLLRDEDVPRVIGQFIDWCKRCKLKWFFNGFLKYIDLERDKERYAILINTKGIAGKRHFLYSSNYMGGAFPRYDYRYTDELLEEFKRIYKEEEWRALCREAIENQQKFLEEFEENIDVLRRGLHPPNIENCDALLKKLCEKELKNKYGKNPHKYLMDRYETEIKSILENKYSVVYWVSHLLVKASLKEGYLVGSRGSVGSSFVAHLSGISEVNPIAPHYYCRLCSHFELAENWKESGFDLPKKQCPKCGGDLMADGHDIPFETFLGFGGDKIPDIDLNFSGEYQLRAHEFLLKYFGENKVFRVGTINTMAERSSVAVVQEYEQETGIRFNKGKKMWLSEKIVDVKKTTGQHPGGILVVPNEHSIYEFSPVNYPANDRSSRWKTTHFTFEDLHDSLLKFDILGHDDPTTLKLLRELTNFDPINVPTSDPKLVELYRSCEVMGIASGSLLDKGTTGALGLPEFGTSLTRKIIEACQPKTFADLMRISGFSHGTGVWKKNIELLVKDNYPLHDVITCRDDIMLYLIRAGIDRKSSFNISERIRKGQGLTKEFETLMREHNVPEWYIESSKKITYIFPKAHATAYVMMSWKIAYYKLYYPLEFYSSYFTTSLYFFDLELLLSNDIELVAKKYAELKKESNTPGKKINFREKGKLVVYEVAYEFLLRGFRFVNISVNESELALFVPIRESNSLRIPLMAVDGLGENLAKGIIKGRKKGPYKTPLDLEIKGGIKKAVITKLKKFGIIPEYESDSDNIFEVKEWGE